MKRFPVLYLLLFSLLFHRFMHADQVGSDIAVSVVGYTNFGTPLITQNQILSFGWMKSGFGMSSSTMTCTFSSVFPVSGNLSLHGGQLTLGTDLFMQNSTAFLSPGIIHGGGHILDICQSVTGIPATDRSIFKSVKMFMHGDLNITGTVDFKGTCLIDGGKSRLVLGSNGSLKIGHNSTLTIKNVEIDGIKNCNIYCMDDSASLILDNVRWVQSGDYTFSRGSILIQNLVELSNKYKFIYASELTSTIDFDSRWYFSDLAQVSFGRNRSVFDREPLYFQDYSSVLHLENATLAITSSGARLTNGTFLCDREVKIDAGSMALYAGLAIGDGNAANDPNIKLFPGAALKLINGLLTYNVAAASNFLNDDVDVKFFREGNSTFLALQNINFLNVDIGSDLTSKFLIAPGVVINFNNCFFENSYGKYYMSAYNYDLYSFLLGADASSKLVSLSKGSFPAWLHIKNNGSLLSGTGDMSGNIIFHDPNAELTVALDGRVMGSVLMNGGKLILGRNICFSDSVILTGTGKVDLSVYLCNLGYADLAWTSSISWIGSGGSLKFNSDVNLSSEWTFSGVCVVDGNGHNLNLQRTANLKVGSKSTLHLKNILINGIFNNILCVDDSSKLILDNVNWSQDYTYSFTRGSFKVANQVDFVGSSTFFYQTGLTSTIDSHSRLLLKNNFTMVAGRKNSIADREPFYFKGSTSILSADQATFVVTSSGMRLTRGTLELNGYLMFDMLSTFSKGGLQFGDAQTISNDCSLILRPGGTIYFRKGHFVYENLNPNSFQAPSNLTRLIIDPRLNIYVQKSMTLSNLTLQFLAVWQSFVAPTAEFNFNNVTIISGGVTFNISGKRNSVLSFLLTGNQIATAITGQIPLVLLLAGTTNTINGAANVGAPVTCQNSTVLFVWSCLGSMLDNITLAGNRMNLTQPLLFADNKAIKGTGIVGLSTSSLKMSGLNLVSTSTLYFDGQGGSIALGSNLRVTSAWTFSGNCVINGDGSSIFFNPTSKFIVERGSTLRFRNIQLKGISEGKIFCANDASKIIFEDVTWAQDSDFTFSKGSFEVIDALTMQGTGAVFSYQSRKQSIIDSYASLYLLDDFTLSYEPLSSDRNLIYLADRTSKIVMQNASLHSTSTGWQLTNGYLDVHGNCNMNSQASYRQEGIIFGDGVSEDHDLKVDIFQESSLELLGGYIVYKNLA